MNAVFVDLPGVQSNVMLTGSPMPASILITASSTVYSLAGAGRISGTAGVIKTGSALFSLGGSNNDYSGTVAISNGTLRALTSTALGSVSAGTFIDGGALDLNGLNLGNEAVTLRGTGPNGLGALINSGTAQTQALRYMSLSGPATIGGTARWDVRGAGASVALNGQTLTKTGSNYIALAQTSVGDGDIVVGSGTLGLEYGSLVSGAGTITVQPGAILQVSSSGGGLTVTRSIVLSNATMQVPDAGQSTTVGSPIVLAGAGATVSSDTGGDNLTLSGVVSGPGGLLKIGSGDLYLTASNVYAGVTTISNGVVWLGNGSASGSIAGDVIDVAALGFQRTGSVVWARNAAGPGAIYHRNGSGPLTFTGTNRVGSLLTYSTAAATRTNNAPLILEAGSLTEVTNLSVSATTYGGNYGRMLVNSGATLNVFGTFNLGNDQNNTAIGDVYQSGGTVNIFNGGTGLRIGHWPSPGAECSVYEVNGGQLLSSNVTINVGWDGTGRLVQRGGLISTIALRIDANVSTSASGGEELFALEGGRIDIGSGGIVTAASAPTGYLVYLGGGTVGAFAAWSSSMIMTLSGTNGATIFDTGTNTVTLSGALSGPGGLVKTGGGVLLLGATNTYAGTTTIQTGQVMLAGTLATNACSVSAGATLAGTGTVNGAVSSGGWVVPGRSGIGTLTVGSFAADAGAHLAIELASTSSCDRLASVGPAVLGGELLVTLTNGLTLASGQSFTVMTASAIGGKFDTTNLPPPGAGRRWSVSNVGTALVLSVVALPTFTIAAVDGTAAELGGDTGAFSISRTGDVSQAVTVLLGFSGAASNGVDVVTLPASVTFAAGQLSTSLTVTAIADALVEGTENFTATILTNESYLVGTPSNAIVTIIDSALISIAATDATAAELGGDTGALSISRTGDVSQAVTILLDYTGTASNGIDVTMLPASILLSAGQASTTLVVTALADDISEGDETLNVVVLSNALYVVNAPSIASVTIQDTPIDNWRFNRFGTNANADVAADMADPDQDGWVNLMEYALGGNPNSNDLLAPFGMNLTNGEALFFYHRAAGAQGISYWMIDSADMSGAWSNAQPVSIDTNALDGSTLEVRGHFAAPLWPRMFMGLKVTRP